MPTPIVVQLRPDGPGGSFRERLEAAVAELAPDVGLVAVAVVVELTPVADARPDAVKLRRALKAIRRRCGMRAEWSAPPVRPKPSRPRKPKGRRKP